MWKFIWRELCWTQYRMVYTIHFRWGALCFEGRGCIVGCRRFGGRSPWPLSPPGRTVVSVVLFFLPPPPVSADSLSVVLVICQYHEHFQRVNSLIHCLSLLFKISNLGLLPLSFLIFCFCVFVHFALPFLGF